MAARVGLELDALEAADLDTLRLSSQVLAHKAALAGMPRVEMFFTSVEAEAVAETAARGQRGHRAKQSGDPWRTAPLTPVDRAAIRAYLELLAGNERLSPAVRDYAQRLDAASRVM
ncbi:MAG TPA: hypothetical protein VM284_03590 [Candidatus Limnocylindria bacterium]|nr:hypothetical protein [Candidatus Limnocylindria bacterium]